MGKIVKCFPPSALALRFSVVNGNYFGLTIILCRTKHVKIRKMFYEIYFMPKQTGL